MQPVVQATILTGLLILPVAFPVSSYSGDKSRPGCASALGAESSLATSDSSVVVSEYTRQSRGSHGALHQFTQVLHLKAGSGWRDPSGLIWYGQAEKKMDWKEAGRYCRGFGLRLPTREEFVQLGLYMGATGTLKRYSFATYEPQVFLDRTGIWFFWSSSSPRRRSNIAYSFDGGTGSFSVWPQNHPFSVRCVGR